MDSSAHRSSDPTAPRNQAIETALTGMIRPPILGAGVSCSCLVHRPCWCMLVTGAPHRILLHGETALGQRSVASCSCSGSACAPDQALRV
eukprot:513987-Hanusia_phi.AAC.6